MSVSPVQIGVLISGSGTNLAALLEATATPDFPAHIAVVISNRKRAFGLQRARDAGVPAVFLSHRDYDSRETYDAALVEVLEEHHVRWVCLAGFMRIVSDVLLKAFPSRVLNIHPSLLPSFPGLHAQAQALAYGAKVSGATVHLVDGGMDTGPIIAQASVPVLSTDDEASLSARILSVEHELYPRVLRAAAESRIQLEDGRATLIP